MPFKYRGSGVQVVLLGKLLVAPKKIILDHENYLLLIERSAPLHAPALSPPAIE